MQAILLAGGLGTRLRSVVSDRPKPMALIGDRPFMEYVVRELASHGITDIIFAVGYKGSMVEEYFGDGSCLGLRIRYAYEEELLGTAGAIKNAGRLVTEDVFFVLNADTFYRADYGRLARMGRVLDLDMALVLRRVPDVSRYGAAVLDGEGMLTAFNEKKGKSAEPGKAGEAGKYADCPGTINGGIYLMKRELLERIPEGQVSLENEMIPRWMGEGRRIGGFVSDGYFIDIGVPEDYFRFIDDVEEGVVTW